MEGMTGRAESNRERRKAERESKRARKRGFGMEGMKRNLPWMLLIIWEVRATRAQRDEPYLLLL